MSVLTMPKFTSQILLLFSKVLHILENLLLKNFTGLKVSMSCFLSFMLTDKRTRKFKIKLRNYDESLKNSL